MLVFWRVVNAGVIEISLSTVMGVQGWGACALNSIFYGACCNVFSVFLGLFFDRRLPGRLEGVPCFVSGFHGSVVKGFCAVIFPFDPGGYLAWLNQFFEVQRTYGSGQPVLFLRAGLGRNSGDILSLQWCKCWQQYASNFCHLDRFLLP